MIWEQKNIGGRQVILETVFHNGIAQPYEFLYGKSFGAPRRIDSGAV